MQSRERHAASIELFSNLVYAYAIWHMTTFPRRLRERVGRRGAHVTRKGLHHGR